MGGKRGWGEGRGGEREGLCVGKGGMVWGEGGVVCGKNVCVGMGMGRCALCTSDMDA